VGYKCRKTRMDPLAFCSEERSTDVGNLQGYIENMVYCTRNLPICGFSILDLHGGFSPRVARTQIGTTH
jgi:hypothetical protein